MILFYEANRQHDMLKKLYRRRRDNELVYVFANVWPIAKSPLLDLQVRLDCKKISGPPHTHTRPAFERV